MRDSPSDNDRIQFPQQHPAACASPPWHRTLGLGSSTMNCDETQTELMWDCADVTGVAKGRQRARLVASVATLGEAKTSDDLGGKVQVLGGACLAVSQGASQLVEDRLKIKVRSVLTVV
ncbi:hypothetical protein O3P69_003887 [Scylla paramamosain]|uniref:Uncharacterized protein n=1 Tax=Scylla paramamosain TaxID=85552 RepID=A0AAW0UFQ9_SCYPA